MAPPVTTGACRGNGGLETVGVYASSMTDIGGGMVDGEGEGVGGWAGRAR